MLPPCAIFAVGFAAGAVSMAFLLGGLRLFLWPPMPAVTPPSVVPLPEPAIKVEEVAKAPPSDRMTPLSIMPPPPEAMPSDPGLPSLADLRFAPDPREVTPDDETLPAPIAVPDPLRHPGARTVRQSSADLQAIVARERAALRRKDPP